MSDYRAQRGVKVMDITSETVFTTFDSLLLVDYGSDGFRLKDSAGNIAVIPTGIPISAAGMPGMESGPLTVMAPASGSLKVSAIYYN
jgi:hypothetical protein